MSKTVGVFFIGMGVGFLISLLLFIPINNSISELSAHYTLINDPTVMKLVDAVVHAQEPMESFLIFATPISFVVGSILLWRAWKKKGAVIKEVR